MDTTNQYKILKERIETTGIGYGDIQGVSWLLGDSPFELPDSIQMQIFELESLLSWMLNCIRKAYSGGQSVELKNLLADKVPDYIPHVNDGKMESLFRLDIAVDKNNHIYITEREECGGAKGMLYALAQGYDMPYDINEKVKNALPSNSDTLQIILTKDWWEYQQDLEVFAQSLCDIGISSYVNYAGDIDPNSITDDVTVYLFGYFDNFAKNEDERWVLEVLPEHINFLNPRAFYRESKILLALPFMPFAEDVFPNKEKLKRLQTFIPWTVPISARTNMPIDWGYILDNKKGYVVKDAAYDGGNTCWGGRGVHLDKQSKSQFQTQIETAFAGDYPRVLQKKVKQRTFRVNYYTSEGQVETMENARIRISPFFIQQNGDFKVANIALATFSESNKVHGTCKSIMVPTLLHN